MRPGTEPSDEGGVQAARSTRRAGRRTQVVALTGFSQDGLIFAAIKAGALSCLLKDADAEIATEPFITERMVKADVSNLLCKLHLSDRTQATSYAWCRGLVDQETDVSST